MNTVSGKFVEIDGEEFYKIENFDLMQDFFMTITSSSDVWNFLWAQGGITAGRKNSSNAIFPYATCDKVSDGKNSTGSITLIKIMKDGRRGKIWQPFESLLSQGQSRYSKDINIKRNLYKNLNGSKIWFEEVNAMEGLAFRYGWTSSRKYGLVKMVHIENLSEHKVHLKILDGCKNILSSSITADMENSKSVLLDAYKKCDADENTKLALFSLSSVVTDKAEPSECLLTNTCWFTTNDKIILSDTAVKDFMQNGEAAGKSHLLGKRGECYILHDSELEPKKAECWEQVFDVNLDAVKLAGLKKEIRDRKNAWKLLVEDIKLTDRTLTELIASGDGIQKCSNRMTGVHHRANVMFNIMRGGIFSNDGKILASDFKKFVKVRNAALAEKAEVLFKKDTLMNYRDFEKAVLKENEPQLLRMALEYLPLTFSRRHGDPSRPWNIFNIELEDSSSKPVLNFEGNWRDIFQNWEALLWSYPFYVKNICSIFLNAMTVDGFNPYRISRRGVDWEVPEKNNPWSQYGYWTDHQVIYLQKLLEFFYSFNRKELHSLFEQKVFSCSNIPYRIKKYSEIVSDARNSIRFDYELNGKIKQEEKTYGTDRRLLLDKSGNVQLFTLSTKLLQIILAKVLNHIPGCGIWMNLQRPEWNDANNALAGYGTSVVTMCYLYRMLTFLIRLFSELNSEIETDERVYNCLLKTSLLYETSGLKSISDPVQRRGFTDKAGLLFEQERESLYDSMSSKTARTGGKEIAVLLQKICDVLKESILFNRREDGLFHSYNTVRFCDDKIESMNLQLMLEGQVAVLSSGLLQENETLVLCDALKNSSLYEKNQRSYMLYPNVTLPDFEKKNCLESGEVKPLERFLKKNPDAVLQKDSEGTYHFVPCLRNAACLEEVLAGLEKKNQPSDLERKMLFELYEKTFHHQKFTGRSGSFYGYEGLGCIYWHQVSKLLLAVKENALKWPSLNKFYEDVKDGLSSAKTPDEFGAFPFDPYSHTPYMEGARQPGMTGQVKEEILARWLELGLGIEKSCAVFDVSAVDKNEFSPEGTVEFTWCGTRVVYSRNHEPGITVDFKKKQESYEGNRLPEKVSRQLFYRTGEIDCITVGA